MSNKARTGSSNGFRTIMETGCIELKKNAVKTQAKMFQFMKTKKGGRRR